MQIYIKNSKAPRPEFVRGIVTQLRDYDVPPKDQYGNQPIAGYLYWRQTTTSRRVWSGENHWELYAVEPEEGYTVDDAASVVLGRYEGSTIGFTVRRILASSLELPNGTVLPAKLEPVRDLRFMAVQPSKERGIVNSVHDAFAKLPFHQPGGEGSTLEEPHFALYMRELVSFFAHENPDLYRAALAAGDVLTPAKEMYGMDADAA
jgi:hypothetical protein